MTPLCLALLASPFPWTLDASPTPTPTASDSRIDLQTGRLLATWRKDMAVDYTHLKLELDFPDAGVANLTGVVTLDGQIRGLAVDQIVLDCNGPEPIATTVNGSAVGWRQQDKKILLDLPTALAPGSKVRVQVKYTADFSKGKGEGLTLSPPVAEATNDTERSPVLHAQGQAELNSWWFPCPDTPAERLSSEVIATIDANLEVLSNGTLVSSRKASPGSLGQARKTWHWRQSQPHAPYLITLVAGDFAIIEIGGRETARPGLAMPVYVPHGDENFARQLFANTPAMVAFLEERFDEKFPWDKYAQAVVRGFRWGGMENTSATILSPRTLRRSEAEGEVDPSTGPQDDLIMHELAHQWMGNLITCRHWDHTWLNEGWATYCEALWARELATSKSADCNAAYVDVIAQWLRGQIVHNHGSAPAAAAIASNRYIHPDDVFERDDDPYTKGALFLHMLHREVGEEAFWKGVRAYIDRWKFGQAETNDFRREIEAASGLSLERFFDQWLMRPGFPRLRTTTAWDASTSQLVLALEQTQPIDRFNPAYALKVPIVITRDDGSTQLVEARWDTRRTEVRVTLPDRPASVAFDPELAVMASIKPRVFDVAAGFEVPSELEAPPTAEELGTPEPAPSTPAATTEAQTPATTKP